MTTAPDRSLAGPTEWMAAGRGRESAVYITAPIALTLLALALVEVFNLGWSPVETVATATGAGSVWLLARNRVEGWWVGLVSVVCFVVVFGQVRLYGEVAIQIFYFFTSLQAIWMWARRNTDGEERPVTNVRGKVVAVTAVLFSAAWAGTWMLLERMGGALPGWDSLTTVGSVTAHMWLVFRYAQSWWIWVALDIIYIPLYWSRGLPLTSGLYVLFLILATQGLLRFRREVKARALEVSSREAPA